MDSKKDTLCGASFPIEQPLDCPFHLISRVTLAAVSALKKGFDGAGIGHIKPAYMGVLVALWKKDGLKVVELGREAGLEPSTMTGLLDRMEKDGLLNRSPDPGDRRVQLIFLTDEGRQVKGAVMDILQHMIADFFQGISKMELTQMMGNLRRILDNSLERKK